MRNTIVSILFLLTGVFNISCGIRHEESRKQKGDLIQTYTEFDLDDFKAVVVKCDLGRLKLNLRQYHTPKMEVHQTYQKYVHFEPKEDTLFIYTDKTPKATAQLKVNKTINLYLPNIDYLETNVSQIVIRDIEDRALKIVNNSNGIRLYNCRIQNLEIINKGLSNVQLDGNNYFENLKVTMNDKSYYNSHAMVLESFVLQSKSLENTNFSNLPENGFQWIKK